LVAINFSQRTVIPHSTYMKQWNHCFHINSI
jgi:hypothetical protein